MTAIDRGCLQLRTSRLMLRPVEDADAAATAALVTPDVSANLSTWPSPMSEAEARERIDNSRRDLAARLAIDFAIVDGSSDLLLGWIGLRLIEPGMARLGYWLGAEHRGRGLMKEAAARAVPAGADFLDAQTVVAHVIAGNMPSIAVLDSLGFDRLRSEEIFLEVAQTTRTCLRFEWSPHSS